ncbi:GEVED domain-containing protein [Chryseobacterium turcicum]|uniref:GEVED domain-containing protein n=1 Tax=Chryseobacterium turcicum TaxID=2898076 RepID=A0A9Q3V299_9FLAO|nr:GEVED domain-containing protein [Chryseobacterium turcicum]MCD1115941.1 GEVED domain-containing protein [Chryseobacterium turcicum]
MKKILLIFAFILAFMPQFRGQTGQIGAGTTTMTELPINSCYGYNYSQQIYTAAELTTALGTSTYITKIRFFVSATASTQTNYNQWVVYIGNTAVNNFATTTSWIPVANMTQVYSGTLPAMSNGAWVEIPLATPFTWDGTSNLVIAVDENAANYSCTQAWGSYAAGTNRGIMYRDDTVNPNPVTPPTAYSRYGNIPMLQLVAFDNQACSTAPPVPVVNNIGAAGATVSWSANINATYVVRYRSLPGGAWTTVPIPTLTSSYNIVGLLESSQYEVEVATVCAGTQGAWSTAVQFTTSAISYCPIASTSNADGYISNVTANATNSYVMSNNSGPAFYTNYASDPSKLITFVRNSTNNTVSVTKTFSGSVQYSFGTGVWIDFNRNGVFETNEQVLDSPSNTTSPVVSAGFTIPAGAYNGTLSTRMRVVLRESSSAAACVGFTWGEVEDYDVKFVDLQPCTTAPPTNISVANITIASATVSWVATANATYVIRYRTGTGAWTTVTLPTTTPPTSIYNIPGLLEATAYEVQVATICGGVTGAFSPSITFTTPILSYCSAAATSADEFISKVTVMPLALAAMNSTSTMGTAPYYSDYTADPARLVSLIRGSANNSISVTKEWPGTQYGAAVGVWIDFNRNGIFETSERILTGASNTTALVTGTFSVPTVASGLVYTGSLTTRMRVILRESTDPTVCGNFSYGEVEDYSVKFIDLLPCTTAAPTPVTVSNLTSSSAFVSWLPAANATYIIRWRQGTTGAWLPSAAGLTLPAGQSYYTIPALLEQTAYQVQVATICNGTTGAFGASVNFTTPSLTYCNMTGTGTNDHISNVKVTPINFPVMDNTSVQTNYISYTTPATLINLEVGSIANQISVTKAWAGTPTSSDAVYAWIDWDRNGIFTDAERIMTSASSTTTPVTATFNVPATGVYTGNYNTTMRVVLKRGSAPVICQDAVNGEVEDYAVKLRPCATTTPTNVTTTLITQNSATIGWTSATSNNSFVLEYRAVTAPVSPWITIQASVLGGNPPVLLTGLVPATLYEVRIAAKCGAGTLGNYTPVKQFTTRCDPTPPNVTVNNVTSSSAVVTWSPIVPSATYLVRYRVVGTATWINVTVPAPPVTSVTITGLGSYVTYEVQVANQCVGETTPNPWSTSQVFTTVRVCEIPPPGLTITQLNPTSAEVVWSAYTGSGATNNYILKYRKVGLPGWTTINVSNNTYTITGLLELTKYEMQVANVCTGTPGNFTPEYYFTTPTVVYCPMHSTNFGSEFISKVTAKPAGKPDMINITAGSAYSDFTTVPAKFIDMVQGSVGNQIIIDKTISSGAKAGVAVWIDFNRNGTFDLDERILADGPNTNPTASATFTVPSNAFLGSTNKYVVMRVAMSKDAIPVSCVSFTDGEVEDYTVRISQLPTANTVNQTDILIYPNPVKSILNVKNISKKAKYKIYSAAGQLVSSGVILNNKIDVSRLINGLYVIDIDDVQGTAQRKFIKE